VAVPNARWLAAVLLAGCGFEATPLEEDMPDPTPPGGVDPAVERKCATSDDTLRLCIDFEDTATLAGDGSGRGHHPAIADSLTTMTRDAELAVQMSALSRLQIAETGDLDLGTNLTVSMWMRPESRPAGDAAFAMLDNDTQYAISYRDDGRVRCSVGEDAVDSILPVLSRTWSHVACTYDGSMMRVWVDGSLAGCEARAGAIANTGTIGTAIGADLSAGPAFADPFIGGLDNVQVFARAWTASQLCLAAGHGSANDCVDVCLGSGD